jgi:hypothetical protein
LKICKKKILPKETDRERVCESERDVDGGREGRNAEPETSTGFCISVWCLERERERERIFIVLTI